MKSGSEIIRRAFRDSLPVLMGYVTMGFAGGVLLAAKTGVACAPLWGAVMSSTILSGTMQFAIVQPMCDMASLGTVAFLTFAINFRYAFYGFSLIERWRGLHPVRKFFLVGTLADEIYALETASPYLADPADDLKYCTWIAGLCLSYWIVGVTAGAAAGTALPFSSDGIEFTMAALFIVILTDQVRAFIAERRRG